MTSTCRPVQEIRDNLPGRIKVFVFHPLQLFQPPEKKNRKKRKEIYLLYFSNILWFPKADAELIKHLPAVILRSLTHFSGRIESIIGIRAREWLFCRLRSGFGMERYITRNIGQNPSITYESSVQMEVTVAVRGRLMQTAASVCVFRLWLGTLNRQMCPGEPCFLLPPHFISPTPSVAPPTPVSHPRPDILSPTFHIQKFPYDAVATLWCFHFLI